MDKIEFLNEFYKHINTDSILVVNSDGNLIRLYCPFKVKAMVSFPQIPEGSICEVIRVQVSTDLRDIFIIGEKAYFALFFQVIFEGGVHPSMNCRESVGWMRCSTHQTPG